MGIGYQAIEAVTRIPFHVYIHTGFGPIFHPNVLVWSAEFIVFVFLFCLMQTPLGLQHFVGINLSPHMLFT